MVNLKGLLVIPWTILVLFAGYWWGLSQPAYDTSISTESQMSAYEAELFIDSVIKPHQYYLDHPEEQNYATGDSEWQKEIIKEYRRLRRLVESIN